MYRDNLSSGKKTAGALLRNQLRKLQLNQIDNEGFLECLLNTKQPQIFAESSVGGDGSDWNQEELQLLGDISVGMCVEIFDDGAHHGPYIHEAPFKGFLIYSPGALLRNDKGLTAADWDEVHVGGAFNLEAYTDLYKRRLVPVMRWIDRMAHKRGRQALVTIPGMGCGQFAGQYRGSMGANLELALIKILSEIAGSLSSVKAVWYDPYSECEMETREFEGLLMLTRPLQKDLFPRPQLTHPSLFGFDNCDLYSVVAWDHVSWPGNDYYVGERATDDGVKAAATDTMRVMTGIEGRYEARDAKYLPPSGYYNWREVIYDKEIKLKVSGRLFVA